MQMRTVTLTDTSGNPLGEEEIVKAHTAPGMLHLAFSVYVFRKDRAEILIQQRSAKKMLWPGYWANTCCSHPFPKEGSIAAGKRRLMEELGCSCDLKEEGSFVYQAMDPGGWGAEHEYDIILTADDPDLSPVPNPDEVSDWKWMKVADLKQDFIDHPDSYTPWFPLGLRRLLP